MSSLFPLACPVHSPTQSLFAVSVEHNLLGGHLVYLIMCSIGVVAVFTSIYLLPEKPGEEETPKLTREIE